jgi:hypothetical protein
MVDILLVGALFFLVVDLIFAIQWMTKRNPLG